MTPNLKGFDHMHVYVSNRQAALQWYSDIFAMKPISAFLKWAEDDGPLTLSDPADKIHLALFEREDFTPASIIAFGASGVEFLAWKHHLEDKGLNVRLADHDMAYSLYFSDLDNNMYEITSYEPEIIRAELS